MSSIVVRFPDGSREFRYPEKVPNAGDVVWPVLSASHRFAVRDAILAQLNQIQVDRNESAIQRGEDPLDYEISVIAHSLGCFHTYEALSAAASEPSHRLRPATDLFTLKSVFLMASPVQLIQSVAGAIEKFIPSTATLATLSNLAIPSESRIRSPETGGTLSGLASDRSTIHVTVEAS